jgi:hypothetical protein
MTQNSQKFLKNLKIASIGGEKEKIQSPQNSIKLTSSRRELRKISNDVNDTSNRVTNRKI